jgi:hypothetical protein
MLHTGGGMERVSAQGCQRLALARCSPAGPATRTPWSFLTIPAIRGSGIGHLVIFADAAVLGFSSEVLVHEVMSYALCRVYVNGRHDRVNP